MFCRSLAPSRTHSISITHMVIPYPYACVSTTPHTYCDDSVNINAIDKFTKHMCVCRTDIHQFRSRRPVSLSLPPHIYVRIPFSFHFIVTKSLLLLLLVVFIVIAVAVVVLCCCFIIRFWFVLWLWNGKEPHTHTFTSHTKSSRVFVRRAIQFWSAAFHFFRTFILSSSR